jgi:hypothetical protein
LRRLVGHSGTTVTELVYRHQLRPVIQTGATVMDEVFKRDGKPARLAVRQAARAMHRLAIASPLVTAVGVTVTVVELKGFEPLAFSLRWLLLHCR